MKIYLYLPLGDGKINLKYPSAPRGECSMKLRSPYDKMFNATNLYVNAKVYQKQNWGRRPHKDRGTDFMCYYRIEVADITISEERKII